MVIAVDIKTPMEPKEKTEMFNSHKFNSSGETSLQICCYAKPLSMFVAAYLCQPILTFAQQQDYLDPSNAPLQGQATAAATSIVFDVTVPNSVFRTITIPAGSHADIEIFARDCCIRDDSVVLFLGGCQVATVDSKGGDFGTHPGETHTLSVGPGTHTIEYRLVSDDEGPSGWEVSETINPGTGDFICGGASPEVFGPGGLGIGPCGEVDNDVLLKAFEDDVGNKIEIFCEDHDPFVDEYRMYITRADGADAGGHIGRCPYIAGQNSPRLFYTGDYAPINGKPDLFVNTVWTSVDGGDDDDGDGRLDYAQTLYDVVENIREYLPDLDLGPHPNTSGPNSSVLALRSADNPPMVISPFEPCDLNRDGSCDDSDRDVFDGAFGSHVGDPNYHPFADFNGDSVVDDLDAEFLGFSGPVSVDDLTEVQFSGISHDRRRKISRARAIVANISSDFIPTPLYLVINSVSDPFVTVANAVGTTADGKPFFDITGEVPGTELDPGEKTIPVTLVFDNPLLRRFTLDAEVRAQIVPTE